jgi:hypothetical protein
MKQSSEQFFAFILVFVVAACAPKAQSNSADSPARQAATSMPNELSADERAAGWRSLSDGTAATHWRSYHGQSVPAAWQSKDGTLAKDVVTDDIITRDQFGDFELAFDWKLSPGGNAGVFYRGTEEYDHVYWSAPEYQLLDDARHPDGKNRLTSAAAAYSLYAGPAGIVKPAGEWNAARLIVKGPHVEHWLNGTKMVEYELWSPDWEAKVKASKFNEYPRYGRAKQGHIAIQGDHEGQLALRNIRIRELK